MLRLQAKHRVVFGRQKARGPRYCGPTAHTVLTFSPVNPLRTAVPFRGQTSQTSSSLSPKRDCGSQSTLTEHTAVQQQLYVDSRQPQLQSKKIVLSNGMTQPIAVYSSSRCRAITNAKRTFPSLVKLSVSESLNVSGSSCLSPNLET